jgi:hypothetical protein
MFSDGEFGRLDILWTLCHFIVFNYIVTCSVLETPFGLLLCFIYDFISRHYNFFYNVRFSLPCWFFILVGPLSAGFLVAALIWLLWSAPDVASLIGPFDQLLTLHLWSVPLICSWRCISDRPLWSAPDVASLIGSFDLCSVFIPCRPEIGCGAPDRRHLVEGLLFVCWSSCHGNNFC